MPLLYFIPTKKCHCGPDPQPPISALAGNFSRKEKTPLLPGRGQTYCGDGRLGQGWAYSRRRHLSTPVNYKLLTDSLLQSTLAQFFCDAGYDHDEANSIEDTRDQQTLFQWHTSY